MLNKMHKFLHHFPGTTFPRNAITSFQASPAHCSKALFAHWPRWQATGTEWLHSFKHIVDYFHIKAAGESKRKVCKDGIMVGNEWHITIFLDYNLEIIAG